MSAFLEQALALGLAVSQVVVHPDSITRNFDPKTGQAAAIHDMVAGCAKILSSDGSKGTEGGLKTADDLLATLLKPTEGDSLLPQKLSPEEVTAAYGLFCKGVNGDPELLGRALTFYDAALGNLPDPQLLRHWKLDEASEIKSSDGRTMAREHANDRRRFVPLKLVPAMCQKAIVAAEDRGFYEHAGIALSGILNAAMSAANGSASQRRHPIGGSTITQQLVKNTFFKKEFTQERELPDMMVRKIQEIVLASEVESQHILSKDQILELYLNLIYFGRASYGIGRAAHAYFGKPLSELNLVQCAFLAGLPKNPDRNDPRYNERPAHKRTSYVLKQMHDQEMITLGEYRAAALTEIGPTLAAIASLPPETFSYGRYFAERVHEIVLGKTRLDTKTSAVAVHTTMDSRLQGAVEAALQEGLAQYEMSRPGRALFQEPEDNLAVDVLALRKDEEAKLAKADASAPTEGLPPAKAVWLDALQHEKFKDRDSQGKKRVNLTDVHWAKAVVLPLAAGGALSVGTLDGQIRVLHPWKGSALPNLRPYDVVFVAPSGPFAELRARPQAQGSAIVMESRTGRVLAMTGGFSYGVSQLNRVYKAHRQPGSTVKPLSYLAALQWHLQPNALIEDTSLTFPPYEKGGHAWSPVDDDPMKAPSRTLRAGLEQSINRVTAHLLHLTVPGDPPASLAMVENEMKQCGLYAKIEPSYTAIIGSNELTLIRLANCYAALSNDGRLPTPRFVDRVDLDAWEGSSLTRTTLYKDEPAPTRQMNLADDVAFYQLRTLLQGVVARGTAKDLNKTAADLIPPGAKLSDYVGGKTGTSQGAKDAWFLGFTNELVIGVWVGYDNGPGETPRTLGDTVQLRATGGTVAAPIFGEILRATVRSSSNPRPLVPLSGPSPNVVSLTDAVPVVAENGDPLIELLRKDRPN